MNFEPTNRPELSRQDINDLEKHCGHDIPEQYASFLLSQNGGRSDLCVIRVPNFGVSIVNDFFCIDKNDSCDIYKNIRMFNNRIPDGFLPFANDPAGNIFLLSLTEKTKGAVFFWDHENESDFKLRSLNKFDNIYKIADNFDTFISLLEMDD